MVRPGHFVVVALDAQIRRKSKLVEREAAVSPKQLKTRSAMCRCGKVTFEAADPPILTVLCYCTSCQEAGRRFEQLPLAPRVLDPDGGTGYIMYRKDRVRCVQGQEYLEEHQLKPGSPTRRVVATCCNSAMVAEFTKGHWLSMYRNRFAESAPPLEMRVMTKDRRAGVEFADQIPSYRTHSGRFMVKLVAAWIAMGFRTPQMNWGRAKG